MEEVGEGALNLKGGGVRTVGVERGDRDRVGGLGEDLQEVLGKVLTMQGVWAVGQEIAGMEVV